LMEMLQNDYDKSGMDNDTLTKPFEANLDHLVSIDLGFILKCSDSGTLSFFYICLSLVWVLMALASSVWNLWIKQEQCLYLQRMIVIFPVFKSIHVMIIATNIQLCENQVESETANKYLIMGLISFQTLT